MTLSPGYASQMEGDPCGKSKEDRFRKGLRDAFWLWSMQVGLKAAEEQQFFLLGKVAWRNGKTAEAITLYDWVYSYDVEQAANEETKASLSTGEKSAKG